MFAQEMCIGPQYCRNRRGQCCRTKFSGGRITCPSRCRSISRQSSDTDEDLTNEEMIFDFTKVKVSSYEFSTIDVFSITLVSELTRNLLSMNISNTTAPTSSSSKTPLQQSNLE